ncbi:MAG: hypothetical protein Q8O53_00720 [Candidatus Moranbacteria bacterium]|nr:hypothetical protein [Candidatus Moranbacteria bacterium]
MIQRVTLGEHLIAIGKGIVVTIRILWVGKVECGFSLIREAISVAIIDEGARFSCERGSAYDTEHQE